MQNRFKFRAVLKTDRFTILVEPFYVLNSCYFIDINKAEVEFECKYPDECFWDFVEEIEKQDYIQEISIDGDLIITKDFTNLVQCTGLKDKYGKLIYEGDILRVLGVPCKVVFELGEFVFVRNSNFITINDWYALLEDCWNDDVYSLGQLYFSGEDNAENYINKVEIIGNIYENPELLSEVG